MAVSPCTPRPRVLVLSVFPQRKGEAESLRVTQDSALELSFKMQPNISLKKPSEGRGDLS